MFLGPFIFHGKTVASAMCLDILENYGVPQIPDGYIFQQDGAPPHFWTPVTEFPNE
jgi:hypothetical protein